MNQQIFVPVTDELIYNHPEEIKGPLIPYFSGMKCQNWLSIEINPDESDKTVNSRLKSVKKAKKSADLKLVYSS